ARRGRPAARRIHWARDGGRAPARGAVDSAYQRTAPHAPGDGTMINGTEYDLICIGSGPAGQRAAIQAAKLGKRVAVIEKRRSVGGVCVDSGTIPSKTFRESVSSVYSRPGL